MEKYRCKCLYGFVLATNGASETAREYNSKQLEQKENNSISIYLYCVNTNKVYIIYRALNVP